MSDEVERFLGDRGMNRLHLRDGLALSRGLSGDNAEAVRRRNREANEHRNALALQTETAERGRAAMRHANEVIDHGREMADGDPFKAELIMPLLKRTVRELGDRI